MSNVTKSIERSDGVVTNDEIKQKIYALMDGIFGGHSKEARAVARDFSDEELDAFINTYYGYLIK